MALTLVKETGAGLSNANSYADVTDGDAYFDGHLYSNAWFGQTSDKRAVALVMATRLIDTERQFKGVKATATQALQWPRASCPDPDSLSDDGTQGTLSSDKVPAAVVLATCELARELIVTDRTAAPPGEGIIAQWTDTAGTKYSKSDKRPVLSYVVQSLLAKFSVSVRRNNPTVRLIRT